MQSANPRRGDKIIENLGELLFDRFDIDNRDILRATEWNPFQLYRSLMITMERYEDSFKLFGGTRFVISPLSSKGLSIGCLLAACEKRAVGDRTQVRVGMAHVESKRYDARRLPQNPSYELMSAWLAGECYQLPSKPSAVDANADQAATWGLGCGIKGDGRAHNAGTASDHDTPALGELHGDRSPE